MIKTIKDSRCNQIKTMKLMKNLCNKENLFYSDSDTYYFSFSIIKLIPYNKGWFHKLINGKYIHKYICNGSISENNVVRLHFQPIRFQPNGNDETINKIINYLNDKNIDSEIVYPCDMPTKGLYTMNVNIT